MLTIKQESKRDYKEVYNVVKTAFQTSSQSDGKEQDLVTTLRNSNNFIPQLSLIAIKDGKIVGYILFTKINIGKHEELALAPLAVLPEYQKQGIGSKLIEEGHNIARKLGYKYSIVLGDEKYYGKFGYIPAIKYGIKPPFKVESKNFMALKLKDTNEECRGIVEYAKEFEI